MFGKLFRKQIVKPEIDDIRLIGIACGKLLGKNVYASNFGGGFENVRLISCEGFVNARDDEKLIKFNTDDSWITSVYYTINQILEMKCSGCKCKRCKMC